MPVFKTKQEAQKESIKLHKEQASFFCPLTKMDCRVDCVCFVDSEIKEYKGSDNPYLVSPAYCCNAMFFGSNQ